MMVKIFLGQNFTKEKYLYKRHAIISITNASGILTASTNGI